LLSSGVSQYLKKNQYLNCQDSCNVTLFLNSFFFQKPLIFKSILLETGILAFLIMKKNFNACGELTDNFTCIFMFKLFLGLVIFLNCNKFFLLLRKMK
jgi:hypothetical protein